MAKVINPDEYFPWQRKEDGNMMGPKPDFPWVAYDAKGNLAGCWTRVFQRIPVETALTIDAILKEEGFENTGDPSYFFKVRRKWIRWQKFGTLKPLTGAKPMPVEGNPFRKVDSRKRMRLPKTYTFDETDLRDLVYLSKQTNRLEIDYMRDAVKAMLDEKLPHRRKP